MSRNAVGKNRVRRMSVTYLKSSSAAVSIVTAGLEIYPRMIESDYRVPAGLRQLNVSANTGTAVAQAIRRKIV